MIENLNQELQTLETEKQNTFGLINSQPLTVEASERLLNETNKGEVNKSKLLQLKNEKVAMKYRLIQNLDDLTNEVRYTRR